MSVEHGSSSGTALEIEFTVPVSDCVGHGEERGRDLNTTLLFAVLVCFPTAIEEVVPYKYLCSPKITVPVLPSITILPDWVTFMFTTTLWILHFRENETRLDISLCYNMVIFVPRVFFPKILDTTIAAQQTQKKCQDPKMLLCLMLGCL